MKLLTHLLVALLALSFATGILACKMTPESQRKVEEELSVPGLEESLIARDRAIAAAVVMSLHADVELAQNKLEVECRSGKVVLRGKVPSQKLKERAEKLARAQEGVQDVLNEIEVDESLQERRISLDDF
jgi:osmotically-inducible protein OsmY